MAKGHRYSLVFEGIDGRLIYLQTYSMSKSNGKKRISRKFPLTQIDAFTTGLNGEDDLRCAFEYFVKEDIGEGKFYVEYIQDRKKKRLEVAYNDKENLVYFSGNNVGKTYVHLDVKFETYVINLLNSFMINPELQEYLMVNKCLNKYALDKIRKYLSVKDFGDNEDVSYAFKEVCDSLLNYRLIRNIEDGTSEYLKRVNQTSKVCDDGMQYRLF